MIIDFHVHLLPKKIRDNRGPFLNQDPAFGVLYSSEKSRLATEEDIIGHMDKNHINRSVVFGFPWLSKDLIELNNDEVWEFHSKYPDRIVPFAVLSASGGDHVAEEASRRINGGFKGLGELAMYASGWGKDSLESLAPALQAAQDKGAIVLIHVNEPVGHDYPGKMSVDFKGLIELIDKFRELKFVLAHMGGGAFVYSLMPEIAKIFGNTYLDTAAAPYLYDPKVYKTALHLMGEDKLLFGSDYPLLPAQRYICHMDGSDLTDQSTSKIMGENAARILDLV